METSEQIKRIRLGTGYNRTEFSKKYNIPLRTMEEWEAGRRKPPEYIPRMLAYYVKMQDSKTYYSSNNEFNLYVAEENSDYKSTRNINIIRDLNGNKVVLINDIYFKGKRAIQWKDVKVYLKRYVDEFYFIADTKDIIYIGTDFPNEYSGSKYTNQLKGANAKAKANAAQAIPELINISIGKHFKENQEEKHNRNAKFGWYRYDSRFALPVFDDYGEVERYNIFHASMLIRHGEDEKMYLYDIIDIKKRNEQLD